MEEVVRRIEIIRYSLFFFFSCLKIRDTFFFLYSYFSRRFSLANFYFLFSFFLGSFGNQDRRRVRIRLSSEEKQKMAASCGQVQPPSSTLLISVRRKRRRPRPRIVLHLRWNVQEWHSRLFKQPCFFLSAFPWDSFGLHVSCRPRFPLEPNFPRTSAPNKSSPVDPWKLIFQKKKKKSFFSLNFFSPFNCIVEI